jgi:hypothetical protein
VDITEVVHLHPRIGGIFSKVVYPLFQVVSDDCGYTMLFNAAMAGIPDPDDEEPPRGEGVS